MDLNQIKQILNLVREHELSEFEIEHEGLRLKIRKDANGAHGVALPAPALPPVVTPAAGAGTAGRAAAMAAGRHYRGPRRSRRRPMPRSSSPS